PLLALALPSLELALLPDEPVTAAAAAPVVWQGSVTPVEGVSLSSTLRSPTVMEVLIGLWIMGAAAVIGRFALGVLTLWRWTRSGAVVTDGAWPQALEALSPRRRP